MLEEHLKLAKLCSRSYTENTFEVNDVGCLVTRNMGSTIIAFRGTDASNEFGGTRFRAVIRDLRIFPGYDRRIGFAHSGFLRGGKAVVDGALKVDLSYQEPLYLTGHSLGGALAVICAALLKADGFNVKGLITFGCPRVLFRNSRECLSAVKVTQYSQGYDVVPTLPSVFWGYSHVRELTRIGFKGENRTWKDHSIDLYIDRLKALV